MQRRTFLQSSLILAARAATPRPNIVLVVMDDFGIGHFAPHARNIETTHFDPALVEHVRNRKLEYTPEEALEFSRRAMPTMLELAKGGVVFRNAFSSSNLCAPARCGILTGQLPNRAGMYQNSDTEHTGFAPGTVLARHLQSAGYATAHIGKWHAGPRVGELRTSEAEHNGYWGSVMPSHHPLDNGFDYWFGYNHWQCPFYDAENVWENRSHAGVQKRYNTELFTDKAIAFIENARRRNRPFFVQVSYHAVHGPLKPKAPARYFERFPGRNYDLQNFFAHVNAVDEGVARLRAAIGGAWDNTLFLFCGDNGAPVDVATPLPGNAPHGGHKGMYLLGGIRIPMLLHWPQAVRGGREHPEMVSSLDLMPTALDAAGARVPGECDGRSLLPMLSGQAARTHDYLRWAGIHARAWGFHREETIGGNPTARREESPGAWVVTDGRYLLRFVTATPGGLFKDVADGAPSRFEMFDLREDPLETKNIVTQLPQVAAELRTAFFHQARRWPGPTRWRQDRWREMMAADELPIK